MHDLARRHVALADVAARGVQLDQYSIECRDHQSLVDSKRRRRRPSRKTRAPLLAAIGRVIGVDGVRESRDIDALLLDERLRADGRPRRPAKLDLAARRFERKELARVVADIDALAVDPECRRRVKGRAADKAPSQVPGRKIDGRELLRVAGNHQQRLRTRERKRGRARCRLKHDLAPLDIVGEDIAGRCGKKQNLFWAEHGRQGKLEGKTRLPLDVAGSPIDDEYVTGRLGEQNRERRLRAFLRIDRIENDGVEELLSREAELPLERAGLSVVCLHESRCTDDEQYLSVEQRLRAVRRGIFESSDLHHWQKTVRGGRRRRCIDVFGGREVPFRQRVLRFRFGCFGGRALGGPRGLWRLGADKTRRQEREEEYPSADHKCRHFIAKAQYVERTNSQTSRSCDSERGWL